MKTKKLSKKLGLNKKTIANLETIDMKKIYGGVVRTYKCSLWAC
jgi:hypothetical protein